jgi:AbrB family looped-hinge helix DNA binding protein
MSEEVVIGRRYTFVIPKKVREELNLREGQRVMVRVEEGRIILEPFPWDPYSVLGEIIRESYEESRDEAKAEEWLKKHANC